MEGEAEKQQKGGPTSQRHPGKRKDCNKEREEEGRMRERKGGLESEKPSREDGRRRQRERKKPTAGWARAPRLRAPPARPTGSPRLADEVTDMNRQGPWPVRARSWGGGNPAMHPQGTSRGEPSLFPLPPGSLPLMAW